MIETKEGLTIRKELIEEIVTCDVCGANADHYIDVMTGHRDWGSESMDSIEHHECCSWDCAIKFMENWKNRKDVQRSTTAYIEFDQYDADKGKWTEEQMYNEYLKLKEYYRLKENNYGF